MSIIDTAKKIIEKGKLLGDEELIRQGLELLDSVVPTPESIDEPDEPEAEDDSLKYECDNCNHQFSSDKPRKRCPECKKHKLILVNAQPLVKPTQEDDFSEFHRSTRKDDRKTWVDENGVIHKETRTQPVKMRGNMWSDTGRECAGDTVAQKKIIANVSERRPPARQIRVTCDRCSRQYQVPPILMMEKEVYICDNCVGRRR